MLRWKIQTVLALVIIMIIGGCSGSGNNNKSEVNLSDILVQIDTVETREVYNAITFPGRLKGIEDVMIMPQMPGEIDKIFVDVGDKVSKNQLLVRMDRSTLEQTEAQYLAAKKSYQRMKALYQDSLIAPQSYDQAKAQYDALRAGYNQALENTDLRAPFSGTIVGKYFDEHDLFSPGIRGILRLAKTKKLKLPVEVTMEEFTQLKEGMTARLEIESNPDEKFTGKLDKLSPGADPITGLFSGEIIVENSDGKLPVGVFVEAEIVTESRENSMVVPRSALVADSVVFVYDNGKVDRRIVKKGIIRSEWVEILEGIEKGEAVVVAGAIGLKDDIKVKLVEGVSK